jgi:hypothetical protein
MSGAAGGLDLRYPIGGLFVVLGAILAVFGLATGGNAAMYERSTSINLNLWWGVVMLAFGGVMLLLAMRSGTTAGPTPTDQSPEGRAIEEREHRLGLER